MAGVGPTGRRCRYRRGDGPKEEAAVPDQRAALEALLASPVVALLRVLQVEGRRALSPRASTRRVG